jgi:DNA-directed RNA polymerase specialized sigma24 family protein
VVQAAAGGADGSAMDVLAGLAGGEPTPEAAAEVAEECGRLLSRLGDGDLRRLAIWKMEGYTNAEIAAKLGKSVPTVERKLARIRQAWERKAQA